MYYDNNDTIYVTFNVYVNVVVETIFLKCSIEEEHLLDYSIIDSLKRVGFEYIPMDGFLGKEYEIPVTDEIKDKINSEIELFMNTSLKHHNKKWRFENRVNWS